ncbi:MAG: tyrosine--tRNA ligase [Deltaproteobacteria bacterium]|nr:tyrosine--tRNA ligase [Candidatus Tharpellaceae bacterium]
MNIENAVQEQIRVIKRGTVELIEEQELKQKLRESIQKNKPLRIKVGFDPTAPDIHLGHVVLLNKLKQFQDLGHTVYFIIGDFTGMIGDPSGRDKMRTPLSEKEVKENAETYKNQVFKILNKEKTVVLYNSEWCSRLSAKEIIKLSSKMTVARMLERNDFDKRFKSNIPICIHEFLYPLLQAYDSVHIEADVEMGGTDQRFNLLVGRTLQKDYGQKPQIVINMPLLEGLDGVRKMSKSLGNYIGITEPPEEIYGKIMSISDELMWKYYELLSEKDMQEVENMRKNLHPKEAKSILALEIVRRFYSMKEAEKAKQYFDTMFVLRETPQEIETVEIKSEEDVWICRLLKNIGLCSSTSEARRLIESGAVKIDDKRVGDIDKHLSPGIEFTIRVGKKRIKKVRIFK